MLLLTMCVLAAGCDEENTTGPSNAGNQPLVFTANLSAQNEVPPVSNAESAATGTATVTLTPTRDAAGAVTGGTFEFQFNVSGLTNTSNITLAHIHQAAAGSNGPVVVDSQLSAATSIPTPVGSASFNRAGLTANSAAIPAAIVANPAGFYFNIHTSQNPAGVVRGQLVAR
jgi:hypothetical protein